MLVLHASSLAEFSGLLPANTYVVVDFYADWCGPCHAIKPIYESLSNNHGRPGSLAFVKVNVDAAQDVARRYGVTAMPTIMFFGKGQPYNGGCSVQETEATEAAAKTAEANKNTEAADVKEAKPDDGSTVSGGYTLGVNTGQRSDWKMSLRG
ncbi:Thioredoxin-like protein [Colletotrichum shisoi]|uniref:Thioredoxin-like protein n=1 Tax=Colletotrichum shisoi TaxID=2078593 RepID=A0A5Q4C0S8_9PEZI|nr:Thioredoxin-like protein [Colletotrichum shisoi]